MSMHDFSILKVITPFIIVTLLTLLVIFLMRKVFKCSNKLTVIVASILVIIMLAAVLSPIPLLLLAGFTHNNDETIIADDGHRFIISEQNILWDANKEIIKIIDSNTNNTVISETLKSGDSNYATTINDPYWQKITLVYDVNNIKCYETNWCLLYQINNKRMEGRSKDYLYSDNIKIDDNLQLLINALVEKDPQKWFWLKKHSSSA